MLFSYIYGNWEKLVCVQERNFTFRVCVHQSIHLVIKLRAILYIHDEDDGQTRCGRNFSMGYQRQYLHSELGEGLVCLIVLARVDRLSSS